MISVKDALTIIDEIPKICRYQKVNLNNALNLVLYDDVFSPINMPPYRQSAMDGYAIKWSEKEEYVIGKESKAGDNENHRLNTSEAVRIFTGALVPDNADTVVIQEHVKKTQNAIFIEKRPLKYANVRHTGEQIKKGELALKKGTVLNEAAIGFLACLGVGEVTAYIPPRVSIVVTGNELQDIGAPLPIGKIYDSNSIMLKSAVLKYGITEIEIIKIEDDYDATEIGIETVLKKSDIVLISGGISVGDYDFVKKALLANNVDELFYKVNQKPGKPLWFGKKDNTFVFALPGNPASALTCFYVYTLPLLRKLCGYEHGGLEKVFVKSASAFKNKSGKTLFLKADLNHDSVTFLDGQSSATMHTFALSNAIACIDAQITEIKTGDRIECLKLE